LSFHGELIGTMQYIGLFIGLLLQLGAFLLFCKGFFPTKVLLTPQEALDYATSFPNDYSNPKAQFDQVVLMVVDAMRADFLFSNHSYMDFSHSLLNNGFGIGFTAFSNPPTVTLPRLKGITTGSTPNFIDAVLNIADDDTTSSLGDQDSWIKQMFLNDWKINMFGDDTWHKLFPDYFTKTEGTASFYVSDFTIVDNNVTRHLDYELSEKGKSNWDCLILHYLGLDHIGHKGGPNSLNMPAKQREMDIIIERIFNEVTLKNPNSLFIIMGDHGMNDVGNHGGSSTAETSAALMLVSQKFKDYNLKNNVNAPILWNDDFDYFTKIDQIDLVPTLSELIGLNIPINNLGMFIPKFLDLYKTDYEKKNILIKNALQLKVLLDKSTGKVSPFVDMEISELLSYIQSAKKELSRSSSAYNYFDINLGLLLYGGLTLVSFLWFGLYFKGTFYVAFFDVVFFVIYAVNFIASSMVEEEHHLWWFFTTIFFAYIILNRIREHNINWISIASMMIGLRLLKAWNNSGQKHNLKSNMKLSTYLSQLPDTYGPNIYAFLLFLTFLPMIVHINMQMEDGLYLKFLQVLIAMLAFLVGSIKMLSFLTEAYNINDKNLNLPPWCYNFLNKTKELVQLEDYNKINNTIYSLLHRAWLFVIIIQLLEPFVSKYILKSRKQSKHYLSNILAIITFILISQTNYLNVPIFPILYLIFGGFSINSPYTTSNSNIFNLFTLLLQNLTFFQFGSTNSLSSVDLTNSFNGLSSYNIFLSGLLTCTANWAGPIFWTISHLYLVFSKIPQNKIQSLKWKILFDRLLFNFVFYSTSGLLLLGCCYHLRFHLFIWTVFSPKILYFLSWLVCNLIFDFIISTIIVAFYV
jgi:ethanolaminephosphotransferase